MSIRPTHEAMLQRAQRLGREFAEDAARLDDTAEPPLAQLDALRDAGLLNLTISTDDGGHGAGLALAREVVGAIALGEPSTALILAMHYAQHALIAGRAPGVWPDALVRTMTQESLQGIALVNAAQVEPDMGSPSHGGLPGTLARRTADGWRITGHKLYVTGAPLLSWLNVLAVTDEPTPRLGHFLVRRHLPGVRIVETWDPLGMRATASQDVVLDDVVIPLDHAVGLRDASIGLQRDERSASWYFSPVASIYDAAARAGRDWLLNFLNHRKPSVVKAPLATLPTVQEAVGRIEVLLATNDWLLRSHALAFDAGTAPPGLIATIKHAVIENAVEASSLAMDLAGNHGLARRNPLERHHRDVLCGRIHAPPNALIRGNAGRAALQRATQAAP